MRWLRAKSVRWKLIWISMISVISALALAGMALSLYDFMQFRDLLFQEMAVLAAVIGDRSTAALSFRDPNLATENLAALAARQSIVSACIYRAGGELFASWKRPDVSLPSGPCPERPPADGQQAAERSLSFTSGILLDGERIGSIYLRSELRDLEKRFRHYAGVAVLVVMLAAGVAFAASAGLQRIVSEPIRALVRTAGAVSSDQTFNVRAVKTSHDELGVLVDAFNGMLDALQERDRELQEANAELETKNSELERFTYTVSHDLRSPLLTIRGFIGMVLKDARAGNWDRAESDMKRIHSATDKMEQLLDELLELSRIGRMVNESEVVEVGELVEDALELTAGRIDGRGVEVVVQEDLPRVVGDRQRLLEVLQNLVENAVKFMGDQSSPRIEIGGHNGGGVFFVRDNGIGIDPRYHQRVFDLFERLDNDTEGTGIGLAIVQRIVEYHGGRIWVESQGIGHGTTFFFELPPVESAQARIKTCGKGERGVGYEQR